MVKNDFRKAAGSYKETLKLKPVDKDAKHNLETALLKLNEKDSCQNDNDSIVISRIVDKESRTTNKTNKTLGIGNKVRKSMI
jgi:hypothetical protein